MEEKLPRNKNLQQRVGSTFCFVLTTPNINPFWRRKLTLLNMTRITSTFLTLCLVALLCSNSLSFVILPQGGKPLATVGAPKTPFVVTKSKSTPLVTPLQANYNGQDFQDDLKRLSKVTGRAAVNVGKAALKGLGASIRGAKAIAQDESVKNGVDTISKGVQEGVKGIKNLVGETRDSEQVQKGVERLRSIVDESQKRVKDTLLNAKQKQTTTFNDDVYFDREDEELFRGIPPKQPEVIVDAEIVEGRVAVRRTTDRVIDAEIISKAWNR